MIALFKSYGTLNHRVVPKDDTSIIPKEDKQPNKQPDFKRKHVQIWKSAHYRLIAERE